MKEHLNPLDYALWAATFPLELAILVELLRFRQWRLYPAFAAYSLLCLVRTSALFWISQRASAEAYFYAYWGFALIAAFLLLTVLRECFYHVFGPFRSIPAGILPTIAAFAVLLVISVLTLAGLLPGHHRYPIISAMLSFERALSFTLCAGFLLLALAAAWLGLPWRRQMYGIAAAFAFYFFVQSVVSAQIFSEFWREMRLTSRAAFLVAQVVWVAYLWRPEPPPRPLNPQVLIGLRRFTNWLKRVEDDISNGSQNDA